MGLPFFGTDGISMSVVMVVSPWFVDYASEQSSGRPRMTSRVCGAPSLPKQLAKAAAGKPLRQIWQDGKLHFEVNRCQEKLKMAAYQKAV
jgi:hypothetical protein